MFKEKGVYYQVFNYYGFLDSYTKTIDPTVEYGEETLGYIAAFNKYWYRNGYLTKILEAKITNCEHDLARKQSK